MPDVWSDKDERQYLHIKENQLSNGKSEKEAKEIASRTVNKQRWEEGRTPDERTQDRTYDELYNRAQQLDIKGRSDMNKEQLIQAIRARQ